MAKSEAKEAKRRAKELWEQSEEAFAVGDYFTARRIAERVVQLEAGEQSAKAADRVEKLGTIDSGALYALLATAGLYLLGWAYALL